MSTKNPLGSVEPLGHSDDPAPERAPREPKPQPVASTTSRPLSKTFSGCLSLLFLLALLAVAGAAIWYFGTWPEMGEDGKDGRRPAHPSASGGRDSADPATTASSAQTQSEKGREEPTRSVTVHLTEVQPFLTGTPELVEVANIPSEMHTLMGRQRELFQAVVLTDYQKAEAAWAEAMAALPGPSYFTPPVRGQSEVGGEELRERLGSTRVESMSTALRGRFRDAVEGLSPGQFAEQLPTLQEAVAAEQARINASNVQDARTQARERADLHWLNRYSTFLNQLRRAQRDLRRATRSPYHSRVDALAAWAAFQREGYPELLAWAEAEAIKRIPVEDGQTVEVTMKHRELIHLPVGSTQLYFSRQELPAYFR